MKSYTVVGRVGEVCRVGMGDLGTAHGASRHTGWHVEALRSHAHAALPLTQMITEHLPLTLCKHLSVNGPLEKQKKPCYCYIYDHMSVGSSGF